MESRRDTLKIIGAIGTSCAFPFSADELYGQHVHSTGQAAPAAAGPFEPKFFTAPELDVVSRIADLIIPPTDTPGAVYAGVPEYIDLVVSVNPEHRTTLRKGVAWVENHCAKHFGKSFTLLSEAQQMEMLTALNRAAEKGSDQAEAAFFRVMKNLTADGYYTSQVGLQQELGYKGNTALAAFPGCTHEH